MNQGRWMVLAALVAALSGCPGGNGTGDGGADGTTGPRDGSTLDVQSTLDTGRADTGRVDSNTVTDASDVQVSIDGSGVYSDVEVAQDGCTGGTCTPRPDSCIAEDICNDGLDNNCDGRVDESCPCAPGMVQRCFLGPPGRRDVGVCSDGSQTCQGSGEFGVWGPCQGGISPSAETCDNADNDCDGCADDGLCCQAQGTCPSGDDPRVPVGRPFQAYMLDGATFFPGTARAWEWRVEGGPCDRMLFASKSRVSYTLGGATTTEPRVTTQQRLAFNPTLSGDYTVRLRVTQMDGMIFECTFIVKIRAPGFRVELCWDRTGEADVDLWVHNPRTMDGWLATGDSSCTYFNCPNVAPQLPRPNWGYTPTAGGACRQPSAGACNNPRLDIDNIYTPGVPENINVDAPRAGDSFRVAANYFGRPVRGNFTVRPMVNVYCGGELKSTFGGANINGTLYGSNPIDAFNVPGADRRNDPGGNTQGSLWRVADVAMDAMGGCAITPLVQSTATSGACVDNTGDRTFNGPCRRRP